MPAHQIDQFSCLSDNFGVLLHNDETGQTVAIDAPEAAAINARLASHGWQLTHILVTHHHHDHVGGIAELKQQWNCAVHGPAAESGKISDLDHLIADGDQFTLAGFDVVAIETPGHTAGQLSYHLPQIDVAFTGDTLFALGCGRLFEGTPADMWRSMLKLRALPPQTTIYCGHEYTLTNARFAVSIDPDNSALAQRMQEIQAQRDAGEATLPTTLAAELTTNPFLRADDPVLKSAMGMNGASDIEVFAAIRQGKDNF